MLTKVKREVSNELEFLSLKSNKVVRSVKGTFLNHVPVNKGGMCLTAADAGHILPFFMLFIHCVIYLVPELQLCFKVYK